MDQLHHIREAGRKAARARIDGDEARAKHWTRWAKQAAELESDPRAAMREFNGAYTEEYSA